MDTLKLTATATINCDLCCCKMKRKKTFKRAVNTTIDDAKMDLIDIAKKWSVSLSGKKCICKICKSILEGI